MKSIIPLLLLVSILPAYATIVCYNETINGQNVTICNTTSTLIDTHEKDWSYLFKVFSSVFQTEHEKDWSYLFKVFASTFKFTHEQDWAYLFKIFGSSFMEVHYHPNLTIPGYNITPGGEIVILSDKILIGDSGVKYKVIFPEYGEAYTFYIYGYLNGTKVCEKSYPGGLREVVDTCEFTVLQKGLLYNVTLELWYQIYVNNQLIKNKLASDSKLLQTTHEPFYVKIVSPTAGIYTTNTISVNVSFATPPTKGITYIIESTLLKGNKTVWAQNYTLPTGVIGSYTYDLTFQEAGTYTLVERLLALYHNSTLVDEFKDNVTFTIQIAVTPGPGGGVGGGAVVTPTKPKVTITKNITTVTNVTVTQKPTPGTQTILQMVIQQPWLAIAAAIIIILIILEFLKRKK